MAATLVLTILVSVVLAAEGDLACTDSTLINCGDCLSYRLVSNSSSDTAKYTGQNFSAQCTQCKNDRGVGSVSTSQDVKDDKLYVDVSGCAPKKSSSGMSPLVLGLVIAGSIVGFCILIGIVIICCCCCKSQEGGPAAGQMTKPKKREKIPGSNFNSSKYYNQSQIEGEEGWKKKMVKKNSLDLENSNSGYEVSEPAPTDPKRHLQPPLTQPQSNFHHSEVNVQVKDI